MLQQPAVERGVAKGELVAAVAGELRKLGHGRPRRGAVARVLKIARSRRPVLVGCLVRVRVSFRVRVRVRVRVRARARVRVRVRVRVRIRVGVRVRVRVRVRVKG